MRILWQNEHYPDAVKGGGGAINTGYIVRAMESLGHQAVVLARRFDGHAILRERVDGTDVIRLAVPSVSERLWPVWPIVEPSRLRPVLEELIEPFDAFVCSDASYALAIKQICSGRPLICRVEGTRKGYEVSVPTPASGSTLRERKRALLRRLLVWENELMDRRAWKRSDALVVKSQFMKRDLIEAYGIPGPGIHVIPNGVDYDRYANAQPGQDTHERLGNPGRDKIIIVFTGRLVPMKNLPYLLRAFARMRHRNRCVLAILGEGESRATLEREAQALAIAPQVRFVGHTQRVEQFLAASDIFVLPSTYEPFGNAWIEAMAAGLPCIGLRPDFRTVRVASAELITHQETGFLVDPAHEGDLALRLDELAADRNLRRDMGDRAQARCKNTFSWEKCAEKYVQLAIDPLRDLSRQVARSGSS